MKKKYIWLSLLVLLLAGATFAVREYTRGNKDLSGATPDVSVTAEALMNAFTENENAANAKYLNKVIRVSGVVKEVKRDSLGSYSIDLTTASELSVVSCLLDARHNDDAAKVKPGQRVVITGMCTGALMDVVLTRCVLEGNN